MGLYTMEMGDMGLYTEWRWGDMGLHTELRWGGYGTKHNSNGDGGNGLVYRMGDSGYILKEEGNSGTIHRMEWASGGIVGLYAVLLGGSVVTAGEGLGAGLCWQLAVGRAVGRAAVGGGKTLSQV